MTEILIGAGGWAYFQISGFDGLKAYARAFNFVEVNSTFYEHPEMQQVKSWRKRVPEDFEFSVRCHRDLTHKYRLEPVDEAFRTFERNVTICRILRAKILHMQTPADLRYDRAKIQSIDNFFKRADHEGIEIAWEIRRPENAARPPELLELMREHQIMHCVDLSKEEPEVKSNILYTRLFGRGSHNIYQFTDEELEEIDEKSTKREYKKAVLTFHGVKMYKDAARLKTYRLSGKFPMATGSTGAESLREVLSEDAKFPATKQKLIEDQGWKIIDLTPERRVHASELLQAIPEKIYSSIDEVIRELPS
jgi:uncharacterized protein YecE (DUF72 family)